jgi:hypothetical protein
MSKFSNPVCSRGPAARKQGRLSLNPIAGLLVLALLMAWSLAQAREPDDEYLQAYNMIQEADALNTSGKTAPAKTKYLEAQTALKRFQKDHPDWNPKLVVFRLNYIVQRVTALLETPPASTGTGAATNAPETQPAAKAATANSTAQVKLFEAGAEPRKVLRLHPKSGDKQTLTLTVKMAEETTTTGGGGGGKLPVITMTMDATVKAVSDNGDISYEVVMGDTTVADEPGAAPTATAEAIKSALAGSKGMSFSGTRSSRGFSNGVELKAPAGGKPLARQITDQMQELVTQLVVPLPEEAVGSGAKWEVKMPIKTQGMTIDQTATYELASLAGERLTVKGSTAQSAANQEIQVPDMPGLQVDLTRMTGKGTGERTFDLTHLLPTAGTGKTHSEISLAISAGGQKQAQTKKTDVDLRFESK